MAIGAFERVRRTLYVQVERIRRGLNQHGCWNRVYRLRSFASRVDLLTTSGDHVRYLPGELARAMVDGGAAAIHNENGKVKSIRLIVAASSHGLMIGPPTGDCRGTKFVRREVLELSNVKVWAHHPRSFDRPE